MTDIFPEQRFNESQNKAQKNWPVFYIVAIACAALGAAAVIAYIFWTEAHKYDEIYKGLGINLPPPIEGAAAVKFRLDELRLNKCDPDAIDALRRALATVGYKNRGEAATENLTAYCKNPLGARSRPGMENIEVLKFSDDAKVRSTARKFLESPCSPPLAVDLVYALNSDKEFKKAADIGERFLATCGKDGGVGYNTAKSMYWMGNYKRALEIIEYFPNDIATILAFSDWRGFILEKLSRNAEAGEEFERGIDLANDIKTLEYLQFFYATRAYRAAGEFCKAIRPLQRYVSIDPEKRTSAEIDATISALAKQGNCPI
ncbi:MAG: hypothetical protein JSR61_12435 [Proteobacteria bacterium]|nr:hypothetical protein [Pseudomonadota bacterium]